MMDSAGHDRLSLIEAKISCLEAELNELKGENKPQEPERWRPRAGWLASLKDLAEDHHSVVDRETIQYTGLKDKNGVKIFEGDVLLDSDNNPYVVEWCSDALCWAIGGDYGGLCYAPYDIKVVGNIYENPELLG